MRKYLASLISVLLGLTVAQVKMLQPYMVGLWLPFRFGHSKLDESTQCEGPRNDQVWHFSDYQLAASWVFILLVCSSEEA